MKFLDLKTKTKQNKKKQQQKQKQASDYTELKKLLQSKGNKRVQRQSTEWQKIFGIHIFNNSLISKIFK